MFDVASGACTLEDYLEQRYSESDLNSTYWIEPSDKLEPIHPPGYVPPPPPPASPVGEAPSDEATQEGGEVQQSEGLEDLIARFHQTARQYEEKLQDVAGPSDQDSGE